MNNHLRYTGFEIDTFVYKLVTYFVKIYSSTIALKNFVTFYYYLFILSKIGSTMSKVGLLPGSSFIHILISLVRCGEISDGIDTLRPSKAT